MKGGYRGMEGEYRRFRRIHRGCRKGRERLQSSLLLRVRGFSVRDIMFNMLLHLYN